MPAYRKEVFFWQIQMHIIFKIIILIFHSDNCAFLSACDSSVKQFISFLNPPESHQLGEGNVALALGVTMLSAFEHAAEAQGMLGRTIMNAMEEFIEEKESSAKVSRSCSSETQFPCSFAVCAIPGGASRSFGRRKRSNYAFRNGGRCGCAKPPDSDFSAAGCGDIQVICGTGRFSGSSFSLRFIRQAIHIFSQSARIASILLPLQNGLSESGFHAGGICENESCAEEKARRQDSGNYVIQTV